MIFLEAFCAVVISANLACKAPVHDRDPWETSVPVVSNSWPWKGRADAGPAARRAADVVQRFRFDPTAGTTQLSAHALRRR